MRLDAPKPVDSARNSRTATAFTPEHLDNRHVQRAMVILIGFSDEYAELLALAGEQNHRPPNDGEGADRCLRSVLPKVYQMQGADDQKSPSLPAEPFHRGRPLPVFTTSKGSSAQFKGRFPVETHHPLRLTSLASRRPAAARFAFLRSNPGSAGTSLATAFPRRVITISVPCST
jgi:hypothetical protein